MNFNIYLWLEAQQVSYAVPEILSFFFRLSNSSFHLRTDDVFLFYSKGFFSLLTVLVLWRGKVPQRLVICWLFVTSEVENKLELVNGELRAISYHEL